MAHCSTHDVLIVGGVGCNVRLQQMMQVRRRPERLWGGEAACGRCCGVQVVGPLASSSRRAVGCSHD